MSKRNAIITFFVLLILISLILLFKNKKQEVKITKTEEEVVVSDFSYEFEEITITLDGAFKIKGSFKVPSTWTISNLVKIYGILDNADTSRIDLNQKLEDGQVIYLYTYGEDASIKEDKIETKSNLININNATKEELMTLPGIGEVLANNIINYRLNNKFKTIEEIMNVSGIKQEKYEKIKNLITVQ